MDIYNFNKKDEIGEYEEFIFPTEPIEINNPEEYYSKFKSHSLSKEEKKTFYTYLLVNLDKGTQKIADEVFKELLNKSKLEDKEDFVFMGLYTLYLEYKKTKYDEQGNIKKGYEELKIPSLRIFKPLEELLSQTKGLYEPDSETIRVSSAVATFRYSIDALDYLFTICHEFKHFIQEYEMKHGILKKSSLAFLTRDGDFRFNYMYRTVEVTANEQACKSLIEIIEKYIYKFTNEDNSLGEDKREPNVVFDYSMEKYKDELAKLLKEKSLAFSLTEKGVTLTDISDIEYILKQAKELRDSQDNDKLEELIKHLMEIGAIPKIFTFNSEHGLVMQSEEKLLLRYFSSDKEEKEIYESALKYIYTHEYESEFIKEDPHYTYSQLKMRFVEEQIEKERKYIEGIEALEREHTSSIQSVYGSLGSHIMHFLISTRLKRIRYYCMFTKTINSPLYEKAEELHKEFEKVYESLSADHRNNEELNNSYFDEFQKYDYDNIDTKMKF